jgi:CRISPR-associated endonuclease/helicase Cas3
MTDFTTWFRHVTGSAPHRWQKRLATDSVCRDRLVRVPTGLGKTAGTILSWLWNGVPGNESTQA